MTSSESERRKECKPISLSLQEIHHHLRQFLSVSSAGGLSSIGRSRPTWASYSFADLTDSPTVVLLHVPSARPAVMFFVGLLVHEGVHLHLLQQESSNTNFDGSSIDEAVSHFCKILNRKMVENSSLWRPVILKWSVDLLVQVSERNCGRRSTTTPTNAPKTLNELLQLYTSCRSSLSVAQLLKFCLTDLMQTEPEKCISILIESAKFGYFDWALTYVGTCFPQTIFNLLLCSGIDGFDSHISDVMHNQSNMSVAQVNQLHDAYGAKVRSLSGILGHLARQRGCELAGEMRALIQSGLSVRASRKQGRGVAYLFKLTTYSKELLQLALRDLGDMLTVDNLRMGVKIFKEIPPRFLVPDDQCPVDNVLVNMCGRLAQADIVPLFETLIRLAFDDLDSEVCGPIFGQSMHLLEFFLSNLELKVHRELVFKSDDLPLLDRVHSRLPSFVRRLYSQRDQERQYVFRLLTILTLAKGEEVAIEILISVICSAKRGSELDSFVAFCTLLKPFYPKLCENFFENLEAKVAGRSAADDLAWLKNMRILLQWEQRSWENLDNSNLPIDSDCTNMKLIEAAQFSYGKLCNFLLTLACSSEGSLRVSIALECVRLLEAVGCCVHQMPKYSVTLAEKLAQLLVLVLMDAAASDDGLELFWAVSEFSISFLATQAQFCLNVFLTALLSLAFQENESLFKDKAANLPADWRKSGLKESEAEVSLFEENMKESKRKKQVQDMVHSGVIGQGLRPKKPTKIEEEPLFRRLLLVNFLDKLCQEGYKRRSALKAEGGERPDDVPKVKYRLSACKILAVLLKEKLCGDFITSEYIWEDWSYAKLNLERFLLVIKSVEDCPLAWDLLLLCAEAYPALWYCLPVVKCVLGGVMSQLESSTVRISMQVPEKLLKLLDRWFLLTRKSNLLPESLAYVYEILPLVSQYEAFVVLLDIWKYFQRVTPDLKQLNQHFELIELNLEQQGTTIISADTDEFRENSRLVMQANIVKLGFLFPKLFPEAVADG